MKRSSRKIARMFLIGTALTAIWVSSLYLASFVSTHDSAQELVSGLGYIGVFIIAIIAGFNILLPVPAATFVPIFTAAGLWLPIIIAMLVIGTTIADFIGYFIGRWSRDFAEEHYPVTYRRVLALSERQSALLLPFIFAYAAFIPFPNEAILIPLALIGIRFQALLVPLILGNIINQTALAFGAENIFTLLF